MLMIWNMLELLERNRVSHYTVVISFLAITTVRQLRSVDRFYIFFVEEVIINYHSLII